MTKFAEALRVRAVNGEDPDSLQIQAYAEAGITRTNVDTRLANVRRGIPGNRSPAFAMPMAMAAPMPRPGPGDHGDLSLQVHSWSPVVEFGSSRSRSYFRIATGEMPVSAAFSC